MSTYHGRTIDMAIRGTSHAPEIGVVAYGFPAGEQVDIAELKAFLKRRAPGQNELSTSRCEPDEPIFVSGLDEDGRLDGKTLEAVIRNTDIRSKDYEQLRKTPRPGHADYTAEVKYQGDWDPNGGGQFSGRMTAPLCIAGGIAKQLLSTRGIEITAKVRSVAGITNDVPAMKQAILDARSEGDSVGGIVTCEVAGVPVGIGGPLFDGIEGELSKMLYAIPGVKGVSFGAGFRAARMRGSENNDAFAVQDGKVVTETNNAGGILGGISNGMPIQMNVAFKPTPSIARKQQTVNLETMENTEIEITGRHDPCIVLRALPVVEAAAAIVMLDMMLEEEHRIRHQYQFDGQGELSLAECRRVIDEIDSELVALFDRRMKISEYVAEYKKVHDMAIYDEERENEKLQDVASRVEPEYKDFTMSLYSHIMQLSRIRQAMILQDGDEMAQYI